MDDLTADYFGQSHGIILFCPLYVLWCFHPAVYTDIANGELQRGKLEMTCIQIYEAIICQFDASVDISAAEERVSLL